MILGFKALRPSPVSLHALLLSLSHILDRVVQHRLRNSLSPAKLRQVSKRQRDAAADIANQLAVVKQGTKSRLVETEKMLKTANQEFDTTKDKVQTYTYTHTYVHTYTYTNRHIHTSFTLLTYYYIRKR